MECDRIDLQNWCLPVFDGKLHPTAKFHYFCGAARNMKVNGGQNVSDGGLLLMKNPEESENHT